MAICLQCGRPGFDLWVRKIPWRSKKLSIPVFYPEELHGLFSPWSCKQSDTTKWVSLPWHLSLVTKSGLTLCDPMNCMMLGLPVHHQLLEFTQTHVHRVSDAIQPSHPLSSPSPLALNFSQHQGLFKWVSSLHQVAKVLEFQLQPQSFRWTLRTDLL